MEMHLTLDLLPLLLQLLLQVLLLLLQLAFARLEFDLGFCGFSVAGALVRRSNALLARLIRQRQFLCPQGQQQQNPLPVCGSLGSSCVSCCLVMWQLLGKQFLPLASSSNFKIKISNSSSGKKAKKHS